MKMITAVVQPFMLPKLARAMRTHGVTGYTVTSVGGSSRESDGSPDFLRPRTKIEIGVNDHQVEPLVELISQTVGTDQEGDGIVFVTTIDSVLNIQTKLRDEAAFNVTGN